MRWLLTFSLSVFAAFLIPALGISIWIRGAQPALPVQVDPIDRHVRDIVCSGNPRPPEPFLCNDRIDQRRLPINDIVVWWQSPPATGEIRYAYYHPNAPLSTTALRAAPEPFEGKLLDDADLLNKILLMVLAIVIVARGRNPRLAYPAAIFLYGAAAGSGIVSTLVGLPWWLIVLVQSTRQILLGISFFALFFLSTELTRRLYSDTVRKALNAVGAILVFFVTLLLIVGAVAFPLQVYVAERQFYAFFYGLPVIAKIVPLLIMAYGIARKDVDDIVLLRWIFASTLIGFSGPIVKETSSALGAGSTSLNPLILTESLMALGYGYALIKSRLVNLNFVLNHAAVVAILAGIVAIVFELGSALLKPDVHASPVAYVFVLLLGISLNHLRPVIASLVLRVASRHRITFQESLAALLEDCRRMKSIDDVIAVSTRQLRRLAGVRGCALYERRNGTIGRVALDEADETSAFPMRLSDDDQVVLRVAATQRESDAVSGGAPLATALPQTSTTFPMIVSAELIGLISIDPVDDQQFLDPDLRSDLCSFAHELGNILAFKRSQYYLPPAVEAPVVGRLSPA